MRGQRVLSARRGDVQGLTPSNVELVLLECGDDSLPGMVLRRKTLET